jgi:hypothetical protein
MLPNSSANEMRKSSVKKTRWTFECSDEVKKPKKPGHLPVAVDRLGPFEFRTETEARRHGLLVQLPDGEPRGCSRELAKELVNDVAWRFNTEQHLARHAPRFAHVLRRYEVIRDKAFELADALEALDDIGRFELLRNSLKSESKSLLEDPAHGLYAEWIGQLRNRALYVERVRQTLINRRKEKNREAVDRGGNTNLWKEYQGAPTWGLVCDALTVFNLFKFGKATTYAAGAFQQFVNDVFEFATGRQISREGKEVGVESVKKLVKQDRKVRRLDHEFTRRFAETDRLMGSDRRSTGPQGRKRIEKAIEDELRAFKELQSARRAMWPSA